MLQISIGTYNDVTLTDKRDLQTNLSQIKITTHCAKTSVLAWTAVTLSHLKLAVDPGVAWPTGTGVTALTGVHTCGSVDAWLVVSAKIQICHKEIILKEHSVLKKHTSSED